MVRCAPFCEYFAMAAKSTEDDATPKDGGWHPLSLSIKFGNDNSSAPSWAQIATFCDISNFVRRNNRGTDRGRHKAKMEDGIH